MAKRASSAAASKEKVPGEQISDDTIREVVELHPEYRYQKIADVVGATFPGYEGYKDDDVTYAFWERVVKIRKELDKQSPGAFPYFKGRPPTKGAPVKSEKSEGSAKAAVSPRQKSIPFIGPLEKLKLGKEIVELFDGDTEAAIRMMEAVEKYSANTAKDALLVWQGYQEAKNKDEYLFSL